jgi:hypothetical protein
MAKRNTGVGGQAQLEQTQYQATELSVPNPVNPDSVAPQTKDLQLIQQAINALGTTAIRVGRAFSDTTTGTPSDKGAQATIAQAMSEEKAQGFSDNILDSVEDAEAGITPEYDFWSEVFVSYQQDQDPNKNLGDYVTSVLQQMGEYEASQLPGASPEIFQREFVKTLTGPAMEWMNRNFVEPRRTAFLQDTAFGLATNDPSHYGAARLFDVRPQIREEIDQKIRSGILPKGTTTNQVFLEGAEIAMNNGDYQRATTLISAVRPGQNDEGMKVLKGELQTKVHRATLKRSTSMIPAMLDGQYTGDEPLLFRLTLDGNNPDTTATTYASAVRAWSQESPLLSQAQFDRVDQLLDMRDSQGNLVFVPGTKAHSSIVAVKSSIDDGERATDRIRRDTSEINAAIASYRLDGFLEVNGERIETPAGLRTHLQSIDPEIGVQRFQAFDEDSQKELTDKQKRDRVVVSDAVHRTFRVRMQQAETVGEVEKIIAEANSDSRMGIEGLRDIHTMAKSYTERNAIRFKTDPSVTQIKRAIGNEFASALGLQIDETTLNFTGFNRSEQTVYVGATRELEALYHAAELEWIDWKSENVDATERTVAEKRAEIIQTFLDTEWVGGATKRAESLRIKEPGKRKSDASLPKADQPS